MKLLSKLILIYLPVFLLSLSFTGMVEAFTSSSTNYNINGEFGNFGGAKSSTNYKVTDTGGGFAPGYSTSTSYSNCSGFQCTLAQVPSITFSLSTTSLNLGSLTTSSINVQNHTATVTTNFQGYTLTVVQDGPLTYGSATIAAVSPSPSTLSAGTEAYGIATSKSGQAINQYSPSCSSSSQFSALTTSTQTVANSNSPTIPAGDQTTLCYAATAGGLTAAGTYTQHLTYIATGKF